MNRRLGILIGVTLLTGLAAVAGWRLVWPVAVLDAAERALARHDPADARARLDRYLARWPDDGRALLLAARAARRADACGDAERFLTAYERVDGPTDAGRLEWALLGVQQGDFGDDDRRLRLDADANHPEAGAILEALAKGYFAAYRWPDARTALNRLLDRDPAHAPALILRGTILDLVRQTDAADADFRRAVAAAPASAAAHAALAGQLTRHGHTREAIAHYERALHLRPGDAAALLGLARAHADDADLAAAERRLDELLAADPNHADALTERGRLALRRDRPADAEPFLARAVAVAPWHRDANQLYGAALNDLGRTADAAANAARRADLTAEDGLAGQLKLRARDNPADAAVRMDLWRWSVRNGQTQEGIAWLAEILRADPHHAAARRTMTDYFERAGQPRRAERLRAAAPR
jgi:Tfp pilus assembly protein PilF